MNEWSCKFDVSKKTFHVGQTLAPLATPKPITLDGLPYMKFNIIGPFRLGEFFLNLNLYLYIFFGLFL
jgi:hypothetical protein